MTTGELYISTDIETDGPIPGPHSMLSFASAAYTADKQLIDTFSANLETLPDSLPHPDTKAWWDQNPQAWEACRVNCQPPGIAMQNYLVWLKGLSGHLVFVGYPATYDFMFIYWYLMRFTGKSPFSYSALDIRSYAMAVLKKTYHETTTSKMPERWFDGDLPHTHIALDDAIRQGALFCNILKENISR